MPLSNSGPWNVGAKVTPSLLMPSSSSAAAGAADREHGDQDGEEDSKVSLHTLTSSFFLSLLVVRRSRADVTNM